MEPDIMLFEPTDAEWVLLWALWEAGEIRLDGECPVTPETTVCAWWVT